MADKSGLRNDRAGATDLGAGVFLAAFGPVLPAGLPRRLALDLEILRSSEDVAVDDLFSAAPLHGAPLLRAHFPRAFLDVNREPYELDPKLFDQAPPDYANTRSLRVAGGLGTIARVVAEGRAIYRDRIPLAEGLARIDTYYKPYHARLEALVNRTAQQFGAAFLIDCHSMPSRMPTGDARRPYEPVNADIVIGDRYGASCEPGFSHRVHALLSGMGYRVARNKPYAGGFITEHYADRARAIATSCRSRSTGRFISTRRRCSLCRAMRGSSRISRRLIAEIAPASAKGGAWVGGTWRQAAE